MLWLGRVPRYLEVESSVEAKKKILPKFLTCVFICTVGILKPNALLHNEMILKCGKCYKHTRLLTLAVGKQLLILFRVFSKYDHSFICIYYIVT